MPTEEQINQLSFETFSTKQLVLKMDEEIHELGSEICKWLNKGDDKYFANIIEEMVDVELLINQFKYNYRIINPEVLKTYEKIKQEKLIKVRKRLDEKV